MSMLVDCSNCRTPLQLPPGASSIRCALCQAVTQIADPRSLPPSPHHSTSGHYHHPPPPAPPATSFPYNHAPMSQPPSVHGRKRAVICGISYKNSRHELKGCVNDAKCMKYLLINRFKFPESAIITLTAAVAKNMALNIAKAAAKSAAKCITSRISRCWGGRKNEQEADGRRFQVKIEVNVV